MKKGNSFYLFFILTIIITRIAILFVKDVDVKLFDFVVHYLVFGVFILVLYFLFFRHRKWVDSFVLGLSFGLVIDQVVFIMFGGGGNAEYWSLHSWLGALILAAITYFMRKEIVAIYLRLKKKTKKLNFI